MATLKGTWRFNDVLSAQSEPVELFCEANVTSNGYQFGTIGVLAMSNADVGIAYIDYDDNNVYVYATGALTSEFGFTDWADEVYKTITFTTEQEVSDEFYAWFTANAVEVVEHTVSGVWKFKDMLTVPSEDFEQVVNFQCLVNLPSESVSYTGISQLTANLTSIHIVRYGEVHMTLDSTTPDMTPFLTQTGTSLPCEVWVYVYDELGGYWREAGLFGSGYQTIDFGTEPQTVSAEFYEWLTANATQPTATIQYNGSTIANLFGGQTATLKCKGDNVKMLSDIVVEVAEQTGGGECNHEVYDLSKICPNVFLKPKISKPTDEQLSEFVSDNIALIPNDVELIAGIVDFKYGEFDLVQGVKITALALRVPTPFDRTHSVHFHYLWDDAIETIKAAFAYNGMDVPDISEGWHWVDLETLTVTPYTEEMLKDYDFNSILSLMYPYGDYLYSLFDIYSEKNRKPAQFLKSGMGTGYLYTALTEGKECETDIALYQSQSFPLYIHTETETGAFESQTIRYENFDIGNIRVAILGEDTGVPIYVNQNVFAFNGLPYEVYHSFSGKNTNDDIVFFNRTWTNKLTIVPYNEYSQKIKNVYTNAVITSQTEKEVVLSGLPHSTFIVLEVDTV